MLTRTDASGKTWYLDNRGNIDNAYVSGYSVFDGTSFSVTPSDASFAAYLSWGAPTTTANSHTVTATSTSNGLTVTRSCYIGTGFLRQLETLANTGTTVKSFTVTIADNIYFDSATRVVSTSNGDSTYSASDDWSIAGHSSPAYKGQQMAHVVSGGTKSPSSASFTSYDTGTTSYTITLAPGETKKMMHYYGFAADEAAAKTLANAMASLDSISGWHVRG